MEIRKPDRRQSNVSVDADRRCGVDRRDLPKDTNVFKALEVIPTLRRTASVPDKIDKGDYLTTAGVLGFTLVNIKEDIRDTISAIKQIYSKINHNYHYDPLYDRKNYQHEFSATRGMVGEEYLHKKIDEGNPFAKKIVELDKTINKTKFGKWVTKKFKINEVDIKKIEKIKNCIGISAKASKYESSVLGGKTIARAMNRTTLLGVAVMGTLELPKIVKETAKGDNFFEHVENGAKQALKSATNVALTTAGIGIGGAIGAQYLGAAGSLSGMWFGMVASKRMSNKIQEIMS